MALEHFGALERLPIPHLQRRRGRGEGKDIRRDRQRGVAEQVEVVAKIQGEQTLCILDLWHMYANTYMYARMFVLMLP